jgi:hypothetical protein
VMHCSSLMLPCRALVLMSSSLSVWFTHSRCVYDRIGGKIQDMVAQALNSFGLQMSKERFLGELALVSCMHEVASDRRNTLRANARDGSENNIRGPSVY